MVVNGYVSDLLSRGGWPRWPHFTLLDILYTAKIFYYCKYYIIVKLVKALMILITVQVEKTKLC